MTMIAFVLLFYVFTINCTTFAAEHENIVDRFIVACHTTDYVCFKRQYYYLRDHVLLGADEYDIPTYEPYQFQYSDTSTCVEVSGVGESELVGISFDGTRKLFSMTLAMPVRLQQVEWTNHTDTCNKPDIDFGPKGLYFGPLKQFSGNATVLLTFPYTLHLEKEDLYMKMEEDNMDVILDILDSSQFERENETQSELYELSEWAYDMIRHVDVPEHTIVPYIEQVKRIYRKLPLKRFILLYPTEDYTNLTFQYTDDNIPL